jgi:uncharacterized protein
MSLIIISAQFEVKKKAVKMKTTALQINGIPSLLWGDPAEKLIIAIHGLMGSKADHSLLAEVAVPKGYQILSFDLPEHGERTHEGTPCNPINAVRDLQAIMDHALALSKRISLFACSLGAYFSLLAYPDSPLEKALFLSPVLDMERLIRNKMTACQVSEARLRTEKVIANPYGPQLDWEYYTYVKAHPVTRWPLPTAILYGTADNITEREVVLDFSARFQADTQFLEGGEHYFHTGEQLQVLRAWLQHNVE